MTRTYLLIIALLTVTSAAADAAPADFFSKNAPLVEGKEVFDTGFVEYHTHAKEPHVVGAYARLKVSNGEFAILMDSVGRNMAIAKDGAWVDVRGTLTGNAYSSGETNSPLPRQLGMASGAPRVPQIKIEEFK